MENLYKKYADLFDKSDLWEFLDTYTFIDLDEIYLAVCEFMDAKLEGLDRQGTIDAMEFAKDYAIELAKDYAMEKKSDEYNELIENNADYYAERN